MKLVTAALLVAPVAAFNMDMTFSVGKKKAPAPKKAVAAPKKVVAKKVVAKKAAPKVGSLVATFRVSRVPTML